MIKPALTALITTALVTSPALAVDTTIQIELGASSDFDRRVMVYDCAAEAPVTVTYINAAPNFLAVLPVPDEAEPRLFAAVIAGSGVRYASGQWVWWTRGADASLYDVTLGEDAEPVLTCSEINNTP